MKLKLLSTGVAVLALLPITTVFTQTADAATINVPQVTNNISKRDIYNIYSTSGTISIISGYAPVYKINYSNNGSFQQILGRFLRVGTVMNVDEIAITSEGIYYHLTYNGPSEWVSAKDCVYQG